MNAPADTNAIGSAVMWIQSTLLGAAATALAIIAVASLGFLMLTGRTDVRRAAQVVIGCFIIFGASTIAQGIMGTANGSGTAAVEAEAAYYPPVAPLAYPQIAPQTHDPYAGAALAPR